jgi:hypothetical protein
MSGAYVQSAHNAASAVSSLAKAFTSNNASGNMLVCCVGVLKIGAFSDPTISDTKGNTWRLLLSTPRQFLTGQSQAYLFVAYNCAAGANTVTVSVGTSSDIDIAIHEYSGCATVTARDQIAAGSRITTTSILAGTIQTQFANEVIFSFAYDQSHGSQTFTPTSGWTTREQTVNPGAESLCSFEQLVSALGTFTNTITISGGTGGNSNGLHAILVSFADTSTTDPLVQSAKTSNASTSSLAVAFSSNNGSGNLLLLAISRWISTTLGTITSVADSQGNTWVLIGSTTLLSSSSGHGQSQTHLYACASSAAGPNTVTVTTSSPQVLQLIALEYSPEVINGFVQNSLGTSIGATSIASGNLTASAGLAFSLAYNQTRNAGNYSDVSATGWRNRVNQSDSNTTQATLSVFDQLLPSTSTIEQTITVSLGSFGLHVLVAGNGRTDQPIMQFMIC